MPSEIMDQRCPSSFYMPAAPSSFFSDEIGFPAERQIGFWKSESMPDHLGTDGMFLISGSKSVTSSQLQQVQPTGTSSGEGIASSEFFLKDKKNNPGVEHHLMGIHTTTTLPMTSWRSIDQTSGQQSNLYGLPASRRLGVNKVDLNGMHDESSLFSSSLSEIFNKNLRLSSNDAVLGQSYDTVNYLEDEPFESLEEIEAQTIGNLLPDDDDLLSGVYNEIDYINQPNSSDEAEDDIFCTSGGMELEADESLSCTGGSEFANEGVLDGEQSGPNNGFAGEHPYGEHPSRTLFVRNINSNVEDAELRVLFEQYGDVRTLYTACKHRGFVMISYYDIRSARNAMRALQNKPMRRRKLDIHFSIPKDNPSEKDINQGTLVVFNLDSSVSNDDLRRIFGVYGEIKEIRETPHKRHHKFIEFYDVRGAEAALRALNKSDIAGKRIKLEPSHPGGARRCLMQQFSLELEQEEASGCQQEGSPPNGSPSEFYGSIPFGATTSNSLDHGATRGLHSSVQAPISSFGDSKFHGISSSVPHCVSTPIRVSSMGNHCSQPRVGEANHSLGQMNFGFQCFPPLHPSSLPEFHDSLTNGMTYSSPITMSAMAVSINPRPSEGMDNRHGHRMGASGFSSQTFEHNEGAFGNSGNATLPFHGHQYIWNNSTTYHHHPGAIMWPHSPSFLNNIPAHPSSQLHGLPRAPSHTMSTVLPLHNHHVGSAPTVNPSVWDRRHPYAGDSIGASAFHPGSLGTLGYSGSSALHPLEAASHNIFSHGGGNCIEPSMTSPHVGFPSPQQRCNMFHSRNAMIYMPTSDAPNERGRSRRSDTNSNQTDNRKQFELDIERILRGEDSRTTLMIKNIPNKYTSKMLLAAIDEHHRGTYDFIYLPIDFKNKCNVGYAFINMVDTQQIIPFYQAFNGKKWEKFNSEKVASLAYARIQGKASLIAHFQNSSLMNEDKRCRPILFHSDGPNAGDQEPFPMGVNIRSRAGRARTTSNDDNHQGSPQNSANGEDFNNGADSPSGSSKDSE